MEKSTRSEVIEILRQAIVRRRDALQSAMEGNFDDLFIPDRHDHGDTSTEGNGVEIAAQLAEIESRELTYIETALERIRDGNFGNCEQCDETIPLARLQALPYATLCIGCQRKAEKDNLRSNPESGRVID